MNKKEDPRLQESTCISVANIPLRVSAPISLKPCLKQLPISAEICGEPELTPTDCGTYILTQKLCVNVPIEIDIKSNIGYENPHGDCIPPKCKRPTTPKYRNIGPPNVVIGGNPSF